ncbi:MAG: HAD hydrolase family protein [Dehalococcoidia bacterium]|nr:HAD hydrolase family protein [Dehalococcoidia bacterium]
MPPKTSEEIRRRAARVRLVLMDVDGVLTDGKYFHVPGPQGGLFEVKMFDSQDGIALQWLHRMGIRTGVISGRDADSTRERARTSHMAYCYMGNTEKLPIFQEILADSGLQPEEIAYIGDDLTDAILMRRVGLAIAVANATPEVKAMAHYVTSAPGGSGAVREATELILDAQGRWQEILRHYEVI